MVQQSYKKYTAYNFGGIKGNTYRVILRKSLKEYLD
jgi:hypothetical protein